MDRPLIKRFPPRHNAMRRRERGRSPLRCAIRPPWSQRQHRHLRRRAQARLGGKLQHVRCWHSKSGLNIGRLVMDVRVSRVAGKTMLCFAGCANGVCFCRTPTALQSTRDMVSGPRDSESHGNARAGTEHAECEPRSHYGVETQLWCEEEIRCGHGTGGRSARLRLQRSSHRNRRSVTCMRMVCVRVACVRVTGMRVSRVRVTGMRVTGVRVTGMRVSRVRVTGMRPQRNGKRLRGCTRN